MATKAGQKYTNRATVVCVTNQHQCERLIKAGSLVADLSKTSLLVVHVSQMGDSLKDANALEHLFQVSKDFNAPMTVLYDKDVAACLARFFKESKAVNVVTGQAEKNHSPLPALWRKFERVQFFSVEQDGTLDVVDFSSVPESSHIA